MQRAPRAGAPGSARLLPVPAPFDLDLTVRSHGWYDLPPWRYDPAAGLSRPVLAGGRVVEVTARAVPGGLRVTVRGRVAEAVVEAATRAVAVSLSLDLELGPFHARAARDPALAWAARRGAGRMLRSPTVFEDAVKILCTTNCAWSATRRMVGNLVDALGAPAPGGARAFPTPKALAEQPEAFFREEIRAGYRAPFLSELARRVAGGELDLEAWRDPDLPPEPLGRRIRALPGFGPYATEWMLRLLGHHEGLALDSWCRAKLMRLRDLPEPPSEATIRGWYRAYGPFAGLALWLELTADWHA